MSSRDRNRPNDSGLSRRQQHNADKRRSANAVGLVDFSQKKGQVRALGEFKKRKNRKHLETSMALRRYRKLMNREGMDAGTGASRKRRADNDGGNEKKVGLDEGGNDSDGSRTIEEADNSKGNRQRQRPGIENDSDESDSDNDSDDANETKEEIESVVEVKQRKKSKKMDPFQKSREKAKLAKQRAEVAASRREANEKERQQKLKRRKQQTKLLQQRTKRGQPIMKHAINNLLYKLKIQNTDNKSPAKPENDDRRRRSNKRDLSKPKQKPNAESLPQKKKKRARKFY